MMLTAILPWIAAAFFLAVGLWISLERQGLGARAWLLPALLCAAFFAFSLWAALSEGVFGFWSEHTRTLWGNQIWFDLLIAATVAVYLLVPRAKALGMRPLPWFLFVAATGGIGLLAMTARVFYLEAARRA